MISAPQMIYAARMEGTDIISYLRQQIYHTATPYILSHSDISLNEWFAFWVCSPGGYVKSSSLIRSPAAMKSASAAEGCPYSVNNVVFRVDLLPFLCYATS